MSEAGAPAARCRLYLVAPAILPADFAELLDVALAQDEVACLRLAPSPDIGPIVRAIQAKGCAVVLDGSPNQVNGFGADGVHLREPGDYQSTRALLGPSASIGVFCGNSRHVAMEAAEAGADYIAFAPDLELVQWWAEVMVVAVVVELGDDLSRARDFIAAGADFICPGEGIWRSREDLRTATDRLRHLLD